MPPTRTGDDLHRTNAVIAPGAYPDPAQVGAILGIRQPQVSLLMRNRSDNFSAESPLAS